MITFSNLLTGVLADTASCRHALSRIQRSAVGHQRLRSPSVRMCSRVTLSLRAACERHNETDKALDLLECMHRAGFAASFANYTSIITQVGPPACPQVAQCRDVHPVRGSLKI